MCVCVCVCVCVKPPMAVISCAAVAAARLCRGGCCAHVAAPLSRATAGAAARSPPTHTALVRPPAAWHARRCAPLCERFCAHVTLHCLSLVVVVVVMVLLLVQMLLLARRGSATRLDARVAGI